VGLQQLAGKLSLAPLLAHQAFQGGWCYHMVSPRDGLEPGAVESLLCMLHTKFTCSTQSDEICVAHKRVKTRNGVC
jgi:hypothetical protein